MRYHYDFTESYISGETNGLNMTHVTHMAQFDSAWLTIHMTQDIAKVSEYPGPYLGMWMHAYDRSYEQCNEAIRAYILEALLPPRR